ncbi:MAG: hypothetical protein K6G79_01645 [Bacteroidales bacterium]|nr:hypothetical protein [Bacteroidales bacterium]
MRKTLIYLLLLAFPFSAWGSSVGFSTERLADIASAAGLTLPDNPSGKRDVFQVACQGRLIPVVVEYAAGEVSHIGVNLFGDEVKKDNALVCNFVERYLLESLLDSRSERWDRTPAYGTVVVRGDLFSILQKGPESCPVLVSMDGEGTGRVEITPTDGSPAFSLSFPTEIQLLTGEKKDELEKGFIRKVTGERKPVKREIPRNMKRVDRDLYVSENGFYETEAAQNSAYFRKKGLFYQPVCESSLPVESVMTLLTGHIRRKDYSVMVSFHQYAYRNTEMTVPLDAIVASCLEEGCTSYVGIESKNDDTVVATVFMVNRALGYSHTFQLTVPTEILDKPSGTLSARAYLYTPLYPKKS